VIARKRRRIADGAATSPADGGMDGADGADGYDDGADPAQPPVNLDNYQGPLAEYLALDITRAEVKRQFNQFLLEFKGPCSKPCSTARAQGVVASLGWWLTSFGCVCTVFSFLFFSQATNPLRSTLR